MNFRRILLVFCFSLSPASAEETPEAIIAQAKTTAQAIVLVIVGERGNSTWKPNDIEIDLRGGLPSGRFGACYIAPGFQHEVDTVGVYIPGLDTTQPEYPETIGIEFANRIVPPFGEILQLILEIRGSRLDSDEAKINRLYNQLVQFYLAVRLGLENIASYFEPRYDRILGNGFDYLHKFFEYVLVNVLVGGPVYSLAYIGDSGKGLSIGNPFLYGGLLMNILATVVVYDRHSYGWVSRRETRLEDKLSRFLEAFVAQLETERIILPTGFNPPQMISTSGVHSQNLAHWVQLIINPCSSLLGLQGSSGSVK